MAKPLPGSDGRTLCPPGRSAQPKCLSTQNLCHRPISQRHITHPKRWLLILEEGCWSSGVSPALWGRVSASILNPREYPPYSQPVLLTSAHSPPPPHTTLFPLSLPSSLPLAPFSALTRPHARWAAGLPPVAAPVSQPLLPSCPGNGAFPQVPESGLSFLPLAV